jgi:hypothetical protein
LSSFLNGMKVNFLLSAIQFLANSCAARTSSRFRNKVDIFSSIEGYFVFSNDKGIATGDSPNISSNGV